MKTRNSLLYKLLGAFILLGVLPIAIISLRLLLANRAMLAEGIIYLLYSLIAGVLFAFYISGVLIQPLRRLKDRMEGFLSGKISSLDEPVGAQRLRSLLTTREIDQLSSLLGQMMKDLTDLRGKMEAQVQERTQALEHRARQMQAAVAVAQDSASIRNLNELLSKVTHLISENFDYYHVGIFLLDEKGEFATLRASNSPGGQQMLERGHKLSIAETSIVGHVANTRQPRVALSVGADAVHFKNPYLPETRSEMALPLITGRVAGKEAAESGRLWGVLDVQSQAEQAFTEQDIAVLQALANQIAIAIENAHLFIENQSAVAELQSALETSRKLYGEMTADAWRKVLQARPETGYVAAVSGAPAGPLDDLLAITSTGAVSMSPVEGEWPPEMIIASQSGQSMQSDPYTLIIPIRMRNITAGVLRLRKAENVPAWSRNEIELINTLTEQLSVALESARLYEETRRRAERERLTGEITARLRASNDPQVILQTAMHELRQALQASQARVMLHTTPSGAKVGNET